MAIIICHRGNETQRKRVCYKVNLPDFGRFFHGIELSFPYLNHGWKNKVRYLFQFMNQGKYVVIIQHIWQVRKIYEIIETVQPILRSGVFDLGG